MSTDVKERFAAAKRKLEEVKRQLKEDGKVLFKDICADIFAKHEDVYAVAWSQYTPYFQDGEACTFSVNDPYFYRKAIDEAEDDVHGDYPIEGLVELHSSYWASRRGVEPPTVQTCKEFASFIQGNQEVMEGVFGDHCQVVVTRDGVDVQEYDHN